MSAAPRVILGSASPARRRVLQGAGLDPLVVVSDVDEDALLAGLADAPPEQVVVELAAAKADAIIDGLAGEATGDTTGADTVVLTCDSMLFFEGALSGKPHTAPVAVEQWKRLRGNSAHLITGHVVTRLHAGAPVARASESCSTTIHFADIDDATIEAYVATGEPLSVAGAFTLDGLGGWFIDGIDGDPSSVLGIGLPTTRRLLAEVDVDVTSLWTSRWR